MNKYQNEIKIGLTIVVAFLIAIVGFRIMQDVPIFRPGIQIQTVFDRVDGISPGSTVYMSGVKVGSVNRVSLEGPDSVVVVLNISYADGIPAGSRAIIEPSDLIGGKHIRIEHSGETERIPDGGYIEGHYDIGTIAELEEFAEELRPDITRTTGSLAEVLEQIDMIFKEGGRDDIRHTLEALSSSSREVNRLLQRRSSDLEQSIVSLQNLMTNLDTLSAGRQSQFDNILMNLENTSHDLGIISNELGGVSSELNLMMQNINNAEGTLGRMIQDPSLYENLDSLAINLKDITRMMKEEPHHFLRHMRLIEIF